MKESAWRRGIMGRGELGQPVRSLRGGKGERGERGKHCRREHDVHEDSELEVASRNSHRFVANITHGERKHEP